MRYRVSISLVGVVVKVSQVRVGRVRVEVSQVCRGVWCARWYRGAQPPSPPPPTHPTTVAGDRMGCGSSKPTAAPVPEESYQPEAAGATTKGPKKRSILKDPTPTLDSKQAEGNADKTGDGKAAADDGGGFDDVIEAGQKFEAYDLSVPGLEKKWCLPFFITANTPRTRTSNHTSHI